MIVVRYEEPARFNCGLPKDWLDPLHLRAHRGFCSPDDRYGWQGEVLDLVLDSEDVLWLISDDGFDAAVTDTATFEVVNRGT